ncbi:MAG: hypothetical protein AB7F98_13180 [Novosphingobium sp.]
MQVYKLVYLARRNPAVSREDWPEVWVSHAKFAGQFAFIANDITYSCYANRIDRPMLEGQAVDVPGLSREHDGVALGVALQVETLQGGGFSKDERALIDQDELRVFDMLTPKFSYYCTETVLKQGKYGEYGLIRFLARREELSSDAFQSHFHGEFADTAGKAIDASVVRCALDRPIHDPLPLFPFDAIIDCWFDSQDDAVRAALDPAMPQALAQFCDMDRSVTMLTHAFRRRKQD